MPNKQRLPSTHTSTLERLLHSPLFPIYSREVNGQWKMTWGWREELPTGLKERRLSWWEGGSIVEMVFRGQGEEPSWLDMGEALPACNGVVIHSVSIQAYNAMSQKGRSGGRARRGGGWTSL